MWEDMRLHIHRYLEQNDGIIFKSCNISALMLYEYDLLFDGPEDIDT